MDFYYDTHIHTCLSPCGDDDMTPCNIVGMAMLKGLDLIAVTDHNTAGNVRAVRDASIAYGGPQVVPGMELETAENIHMVCLFETVEAAEDFGAYVRGLLPDIRNKPDVYGVQRIADANDLETGTEERLLLNAVKLDMAAAVDQVRRRGGVCYPAHVDREANGILAILGEIPSEYRFSSIEISTNAAKELQNTLAINYNLIYGSDAHYLENISERTHFYTADHPGVRGFLRRASGGR